MDWIDAELARLDEAKLYRSRRRLESGQGAEVRWRHADFVNFSSNDYLGYATDPRLSRAAARAAVRYGSGAGASPLVSGTTPPLQRLERDLAIWEQTQAALVFPCGYTANLGVIGALGRGGVIFSDELNHASLIDGCRLARATVHVYRHNDLEHLRELLKAYPGPRRLIVSDSVFSMDGDLADVAGLVALADEHDTLLLLDEAHATGVLGEQGRGLFQRREGRVNAPVKVSRVYQHPGKDGRAGPVNAPVPEASDACPQDRVIKVGTLSKALAAQGGFVCAVAKVIDYLINTARPYIFSTALAPSAAAAARRAIELVAQEPQRRATVLALAEQLRTQLRAAGYDVGRSTCQIVPVIVGDASEAIRLQERLASRRLLVPAIRPPSVPPNTSRLRVSLSAAHTEEDVARLVAGLRK